MSKKAALKLEITPETRKILHEVVSVNGVIIPDEAVIISVEMAKKMLGWEAEDDYQARREKADSEDKAGSFGDDYVLKDEEGKKVKCWNNYRNRPFDESHCRRLAQDILNRKWAGPTTMLGETVNGETIVIGRTGLVESGQHRLIGLVLASQIWAGKNKGHWQEKWPEEPVLESLVVCGVSEAPCVIQTLDNVKPRTVDDVFYTSEIFQALIPSERRECSRMLGKAVALLWRRTGVSSGAQGNTWNKYQTHSESMGLVERHPKILHCVKHLFEENKDRTISGLKISAGECAGLLYLMGCSHSSGDDYRNCEPAPCEKALDWKHWERAKLFWSLLAKDDKKMKPVRFGIAALVDEDLGTEGRKIEKFAVLAQAWAAFKDGDIQREDTDLSYDNQYQKDEDGNDQLVARHLRKPWPDMEGIDLGEKYSELKEAEPTPEEVEAAKIEERKQRAEMVHQKILERRAKKGESK